MSSERLTLGIDTSGQAGSIGLLRGDAVLEERSLSATGRRHARTLVAEVRSMLRDHEAGPRDCELVAVSVGPGSFTGLRVGVVFAKTFGYLTGAPIAAVDTFAAIATNSPEAVQRVWVLEDAQRGALFAGLYERGGDCAFTAVGSTEILTLEEVAARAGPEEFFSGPGVKRLSETLRSSSRCLPESYATPRGVVVAALGRKENKAGRTADPFALVPHYIRRSAAEETAEQKAKAATGRG